jgi:hypothetical protein
MHDLGLAAGIGEHMVRRHISALRCVSAQQPLISDDATMTKTEDGLECTMQVQPVVQSVSTHVIGLDATLDEVKAIAHGVISQNHMRLGIE